MIRLANRFDTEDIIDMFLDFAKTSAYSNLVPEDPDLDHISNMIRACAHAGFVLVGEVNDEPVGFLIAIRQPSMWDPRLMNLQETIWYVKPEYRKTSIGGKLFLEYSRRAEEMLASGEITHYTTTRMSTTPDLDLEKRGWQLKEKMYMKGVR